MRRYNKCNKKGTIFDFLKAIIGIFIMGVLILMALKLNVTISTDPDYIEEINSSGNATIQVFNDANRGATIFDMYAPAMFIAVMMASWGLAFAINAHPSVFIVNIFLLLILLGLASELSNAHEEIMADSDFNTESGMLSITNSFWANAPTIALVDAVVVTVLMIAGIAYGNKE